MFQYTPLPESEGSDVEKPDQSHRHLSPVSQLSWRVVGIVSLIVIITASMSGLIGHRMGTLSPNANRHYNIDQWHFQTVTKSFQYNRTFADAPSPETNAAWMSIFPPHGGFFHDKNVAKDGASLAVYHQLHCLDGIRHAYWILHEAVMQGRNISLDEQPDWYTAWHTRHCIDFLRQMLMCNADVTVERNDPSIGGIRGFGINHQCKNWEDVVGWTLDRQKAGQDQGYIYALKEGH